MKRIAVLALAIVALAALAAPPASARHTLAHRVTALEKKVNDLHKFAHNCLAADWVPIAWYGDPAGGLGYLYDNDGPNPAQAPFYTSALDIAPNPAETTFIVARVRPSCIGQIAARTSFAERVAALHRGLKALR